MSERNVESVCLYLAVCICIIAVCVASVKGCQRVRADSIRADAEARIAMHKEFGK
jgi:hypothetical protein